MKVVAIAEIHFVPLLRLAERYTRRTSMATP
jgi:hypothetical protein